MVKINESFIKDIYRLREIQDQHSILYLNLKPISNIFTTVTAKFEGHGRMLEEEEILIRDCLRSEKRQA